MSDYLKLKKLAGISTEALNESSNTTSSNDVIVFKQISEQLKNIHANLQSNKMLLENFIKEQNTSDPARMTFSHLNEDIEKVLVILSPYFKD